MSTSRSGAGGKIVTNRRKQRLAATPYDRPAPQPLRTPPPKSPNWFTGVVVPSARALASGAGKILSTIFAESESSSSEDEESASEDGIDNNMLNEKNASPSELMQYGQESHLSDWTRETKRVIEQLIMQETFSRKELDRLIEVLNSRVTDWSMEAGEKSSLVGSPEKTTDHEDSDIYNKAVEEAKKWFQEKKVGSSSVAKSARCTHILNSTGLEHLETGGSPVDMARFYMKDRPPWASSGRDVELKTPSANTMKLFKEGTLYSVGHDSKSSSKKRSFLASGSWNIQEELRRVRTKATEDMLHTPSTKIDLSFFAVEPIRVDSLGASEVVFAVGERTSEPEPFRKTKLIDALVDAGLSSDPALSAFVSRKDGEAKPVTSVSGNNEASEAVLADSECAASKFPQPSSPNHAEEHHTDPVSEKINGPPTIELTEFGGEQSVNGLASSQTSLSAGVAMGKNHEQHDEENHGADTVNEKNPENVINAEGNCELLSEACMDVPIVTETDSIARGSQNMQSEELSPVMAQPSPKEKFDIVAGKQQGRRSGRYNRRGRGKR